MFPKSSFTSRKAARLAAWDKRYVWHPFTQHLEWAARQPIVIESGRGVWLRDARGRRFIDGVSSLWVNVFGHRHPALNRAIQRQLGKIAHSTFLGLTHEPAILLAKELIRIAPRGLSRVFYSDNGSTSVEVALKMAYQYWQLKGKTNKRTFVTMRNAYHGDTIGAVSVGGVAMFHERFRDLLFKTRAVPPGDFDRIERFLKSRRATIAAVVMEPLIQGASGMRLMPKGYLAHVARLCKRHGVLLIIDEVATGFGRTGKMFAVEHENVAPDFLCVAKSLTGGYLPLAATLTTEEVYRAYLGKYESFKTFFHGHTYTANPLACSVALAALGLYKRERLLENVRERAAQLRDGLDALKRHPRVGEIRQLGLMAGIELLRDPAKKIPFTPRERMGLRVCDAALRHGVWLRPLGDVVVLMPPLSINARDTKAIVRAVRRSINEVTQSEA